MKDQNCAYCVHMESGVAPAFGYPVCAMKSGYLYIFREQSKPGRVILAYHDHVSEMVDISDEERDLFFADVAKVSNVLHKLFHPDKVNYGMYGDTGCHLHMHLVPKYNGGDEWGGVFQMNPDKVYLSEEEYEAMAEKIRAELQSNTTP